jgi:hypothetical protein
MLAFPPGHERGDADIVEFVPLGMVADQALRAREDVVGEPSGISGGEHRPQHGFGEGAEKIGVASGEGGGVTGAPELLDEGDLDLINDASGPTTGAIGSSIVRK